MALKQFEGIDALFGINAAGGINIQTLPCRDQNERAHCRTPLLNSL